MIGRIAIGLFLLLILFGTRDVITGGVHDFRTEEITQNVVVATEAETTAEIALSSELFSDKTSEVISISSSISETPVATSYDPETQTLTVAALTASSERTLTIEYYSQIDDEFMPIIGPFLLILVFGGIFFAIVYGVWKKR